MTHAASACDESTGHLPDDGGGIVGVGADPEHHAGATAAGTS